MTHGNGGNPRRMKDADGRFLVHNASVADAYAIADKVAQFYMAQVPKMVEALVKAEVAAEMERRFPSTEPAS